MSTWQQHQGREPFVQRTNASDKGAMVGTSVIADTDPIAAPLAADQNPIGGSKLNRSSERAEIARRVLAFRDHQRLLRQQRDDYCDAVQARTRAALRDDRGSPRN